MRIGFPQRPAITAAAATLLLYPLDLHLSTAAAQSDPSPAGEVRIRPVESDLARKPWVTVSASSGAGAAGAAVDGDPATAWIPSREAPGEWLRLDLGGRYDNLRKVEVLFPDAGADYRYAVEVSGDGTDWERIVEAAGDPETSRPASRGGVHLFTRPGVRYVRLVPIGVSEGARPGVAEISVFNYLRDDLVLGADLSFMDDFRDRKYFARPNRRGESTGAGPHLLDVVKDRGMDFIRLRIFNEPRSERTGEPRDPPTQGPRRSLESARLVKERGLQLGIDFHYADSWADPGKQPKPRAWAELGFDSLATALHDFTRDFLGRLNDQGTPPDKVAIGNEIINGFLWGSESAEIITAAGRDAVVNPPYFHEQAAIYQSRPGGRILWRYWGSEDPEERRRYEEGWDRFATLVAAGIRAVREATPAARVELHTIVGSGEGERTGLEKTMEFWNQLLSRLHTRGVEPDVLAISYYPEWHGTVEQLDVNLYTIATAYPQYEVNIAETAYPASGGTPQPNAIFPRTVQGQADAIQRVFQAANDVVDNRGVGVLLWEPASFQTMFRPVPEMEGYFEPRPSIDVFNRSHARQVLEDRIYTSTSAGEPPELPAAVDVLDTQTGVLERITVRWRDPQVERFREVGEVLVEGSTEAGEVLAVVDVLPR